MDQLVSNLQNLKALYEKDDLAGAKSLLTQMKIEMTKFNFLVPDGIDNAKFVLAREILEYAVLLSVKLKDSEGFERNFAQVKNYYNDNSNSNVPSSERKQMLLGLNLLRLLAYNRIAEYHTELEIIPVNMLENVYIKYSIQLEQFLMEGNYNKIFEHTSPSAQPAKPYNYFMDLLIGTVRSEIASCIEKAYNSLKVTNAQKLLRFNSADEFTDFATKRKWTITGDTCNFQTQENKKLTIPTMELIHQTLNYAKELERIV